MKLQVLELPKQRVGDVEETPFVLVFSEVDGGVSMFEDLSEEDRARLREMTGARAFLAFDEPVEVLSRATE